MGVKLARLELDFVRRKQASPWAGRILLAVALAFGGDVALSYVKAKDAVRIAEMRLDGQATRVARKPASPEELATARDTLQRLATPWDNLFAALESAASEEVALLAIEPDPKAGTVTISGDSKDYLAALSYVLNLSRSELLSRVHLVRHELKGNAVGFAVSATWSRR